MASPRYLDSQETPSPLAGFLGAASTRLRENQIEKKDTDILKQIYQDHLGEKYDIGKALQAAMTTPGLSPSKRVQAIDSLNELNKQATSLQKQALVNQQKQAKEDFKAEAEDKADKAELAFLASIEGKKMKPSQIYSEARKAGLSRVRAKDLSNIHRMEGREGRLSEADVTRDYDFELRENARLLKEETNKAKKQALEKERDILKANRRKDLIRYRAGEDIRTTTMEEEDNAALAEELEVDEAILELTQEFPPAQHKGNQKKDDKGRIYDSDGVKWTLSK